jgi:hypothetical protein
MIKTTSETLGDTRDPPRLEVPPVAPKGKYDPKVALAIALLTQGTVGDQTMGQFHQVALLLVHTKTNKASTHI